MEELQFLSLLGKESLVFVSIVLVWYLFVKPKDAQIDKKDTQITELMGSNRTLVKENSEQLSNISETMEKISFELVTLNANQYELRDRQDELWREVVQLKKER